MIIRKMTAKFEVLGKKTKKEKKENDKPSAKITTTSSQNIQFISNNKIFYILDKNFKKQLI